jgi:CBS domain-containing protein
MQVKDVMTPEVELAAPDDTLQEAATRMRCWNVGILPVRENDRLVGVLTDRDIVIRSVCEGRDPKQTLVREAMTPQVVYCFDDQDLAEAADLMEAKKVRRLVVLNRAKRLVGVVSVDDLAQEAAIELRVGEVLERVTSQ